MDEPRARQAAGLCRKAGADPQAIPRWIEEGRRRRAAARMPPFSGGLHGGAARRSRARYTVIGGCASVHLWKNPQDEIYSVQGTDDQACNYRGRAAAAGQVQAPTG